MPGDWCLLYLCITKGKEIEVEVEVEGGCRTERSAVVLDGGEEERGEGNAGRERHDSRRMDDGLTGVVLV